MSDDARIFAKRAEAAYDAGDLETSGRLWRQVADHPQAGELRMVALNNLSHVLTQQGRTAESVEVWRTAASAGNHAAMRSLAALALRNGDPAEAVRWWRQAAETGDVRSMSFLAHHAFSCGNGEGAAGWLTRAAAQGDYESAMLLADRNHLHGTAGDALMRETAEFARAGSSAAMARLGSCHYLRAEPEEAERWLVRAVQHGAQGVIQELSKLYFYRGEITKQHALSELQETETAEPELEPDEYLPDRAAFTAAEGAVRSWEYLTAQSDDQQRVQWGVRQYLIVADHVPPDAVSPPEHVRVLLATAVLVEQLGRLDDALWLLTETVRWFVADPDADFAARVVRSAARTIRRFDLSTGESTARRALWEIGMMVPTQAAAVLQEAAAETLSRGAGLLAGADGTVSGEAAEEFLRANRDIWGRFRPIDDPGVRERVALAGLNIGNSLTALGRDHEARAAYSDVVDYLSDAVELELAPHALLAGHAVGALASLHIPDPSFRTDVIDAQQRARWRMTEKSERGAGPPLFSAHDAESWTRRCRAAASTMHASASTKLRAVVAAAMPFVLVLRNFELTEEIWLAPPGGALQGYDGEPIELVQYLPYQNETRLEDVLAPVVPLVMQVGSPLISDWELQLGGPRLYLPDDDWKTTVTQLIILAEGLVVRVGHLTPGVVEELALIRSFGRESDTVVLLPRTDARMMLRVTLDAWGGPPPPDRKLISADDPVITGFPQVGYFDELSTTDGKVPALLGPLVDAVRVAQSMTPSERVARYARRAARGGLSGWEHAAAD